MEVSESANGVHVLGVLGHDEGSGVLLAHPLGKVVGLGRGVEAIETAEQIDVVRELAGSGIEVCTCRGSTQGGNKEKCVVSGDTSVICQLIS